MAQDNVNREIDELYQLPLAEFTAARDALAKRAGAEGAAIRKLPKPNAAAWAVNQLYWKRRKVFDRLTSAAERLRAAHGRRLAGKDADIERAELAHAAALRGAVEAARELLAASGDPVSSSTMTAVDETLQALPWSDPPGRLIRPLRPQGFAALLGVLPEGAAAARHVAEVIDLDRSRRERARSETRVERSEREEQERRREIASLESARKAAEREAREGDRLVGRARTAVDEAEAERDRLTKALDEANAEVQRARGELATAQKRSREAAAELARLDQRLNRLRDGHTSRPAGRS